MSIPFLISKSVISLKCDEDPDLTFLPIPIVRYMSGVVSPLVTPRTQSKNGAAA